MNSDEAVLGYFQVSGVSQERIFIPRDTLPRDMPVATGYEHCQGMIVLGEAEEEIDDGWIVLDQFTWLDTLYTTLTNYHDCYDCTAHGSNKKPEFWIDNK